MSNHYGDFPTSGVVYMDFDSFAAATGAPSAVTNFASSDIQIYKDGGTTQRSSSAGITVSTTFDSQTGLQMVAIDTSDNTDAGFYAAGHEYNVAVADITVDGQTLRFWLGAFSIERSGGALALIKAIKSGSGVNVTQWNGQAVTNDANNVPNVSAKYWAGTAITATSIPVATAAGAAGGLFIAGTNAATTVTTSFTTTFTGNLTGSVASVTGAVGSVTGAVGSVTGNVGGNVTGSVASVLGAVGSVTGNVGGNVVGSVTSVTAGVTVTTNNDKTGYELTVTPPTSAQIADKHLGRNIAGGSDGGRTVSEAYYAIRNKTAIVAGTLSVYGTDDTTVAWTAAVTTAAGNPIDSIDPA